MTTGGTAADAMVMAPSAAARDMSGPRTREGAS